MQTILCTETGHKHEYTRETYDTMCQYDVIIVRGNPLYGFIDTIATDEYAKWWHEYERVMDNCQMAADDKGLTVEDVANGLDLDFSDLGADMDKIAEWLDVRPMFEEEQA